MTFVRATYAMKRQLTTILLMVSAMAFTIKAAADDRWETLRAINWVENPTNHTRMGRFGELGPYQFRPGTWRMHTRKPFRQAIEREAADEVAVRHYEWIKRSLEQAGADATAFNIAMAWNTGVDNVLKGRAPAVSYDYANRVVNLVQNFKQHAPAATVAVTRAPARPALSLASQTVNFAVAHNAPKFEIVLPPPPEDIVLRPDRTPMPVASDHRFTFTTAATLTPSFSL